MAQPLILPKWKFFDANGAVLAGGMLYSYQAGSTTPLATYTDSTGVTPNTNPVVLDANGECVVWLGTAAYKFVLKDSLGNVLWTADGIQSIPDGSITTVKLADGSVTTAKIVDANVTTAKLADASVTTAKIADANVTTAKIADGAVTPAKLTAAAPIAFLDRGDPRNGDGVRAFPTLSFSSPTLISVPASPALGDGQGVRWSPNGKLLFVAENNSEGIAIFQRLGDDVVRLSPGAVTSGTLGTLSSAVISPDGEYLSACGTGSNNVFQRSGNTYQPITIPGFPTSLIPVGSDWSPDGRYLALTGGASGSNPKLYILKRSDVSRNHIVASYKSTAGQTIPASSMTNLNFPTMTEDNMSAVSNASSSFTFTAPRANGYRVICFVKEATNSQFPAGTIFQLRMAANGGFLIKQMGLFVGSSTSAANPAVYGETWIPMQAGTTFTIQAFQSNAGSIVLSTTDGDVYVDIIEDAGFAQLSSWAYVASPATLPTGAGQCCKFSPDGKFLAVGHATSPFVSIYSRSGDSFTKVSDPAILPTGQVNGVDWSPDGLKLTCVHATTPFITTYTRTSVTDTTFVKATAPATLPASTGNGCRYNSTGDKLAVAHDTSPFVTIYSVSGSTLTKDPDPSSLPPGNGKSVDWTPDGKYLTVGHVSSPYVSTYKTSSTYGSNAFTYVKEVDLV